MGEVFRGACAHTHSITTEMQDDGAEKARKVADAIRLQDEMKTQILAEKLDFGNVFLDAEVQLNREREDEIALICDSLFLSNAELEQVVDGSKSGEIRKQILSKIATMTHGLAESSKITFGEKRYMEGLVEGLAEYGERKDTMKELYVSIKDVDSRIKEMHGILKFLQSNMTQMQHAIRALRAKDDDANPPPYSEGLCRQLSDA